MSDGDSTIRELLLQLNRKVADFITSGSTDRATIMQIAIKVAQLETALEAEKDLINERFRTQSIELDRASAVLNQRLEVMNEFRDQLNRERATYVKKDEMSLTLNPLADRLTNIETGTTFSKGKGIGMWSVITAIVGASALITFVISLVLHSLGL